MTARKQLNEMKQFIQIAEGSWALPRSKEDFDKLAELLKGNTTNAAIQDRIYNILGDDDLFDRLDKLEPQAYDGAEVITQWMKDQRTNEYSNFPNIWNTFQLSQREDSPMNEDELGSWGNCRRCEGHGTHLGIDCWKCEGTGNEPTGDEYDFGPAAQGKSDVMMQYGTQQGKEVTDLPMAKPLEEDDPDGMGHYDVTVETDHLDYPNDLQTALPYDEAYAYAEEYVKNNFAFRAERVEQWKRGEGVEWNGLDRNGDSFFVRVVPTDEADVEAWQGESIELGDIVESILETFPGQPKDYEVSDEELAAEKSDEFEKDSIDSEIEDEELGLRFD